MASYAFTSLFFSAFLAASMAALLVTGFQFEVGSKLGWRKPTGKEPETYNEWAAKNRFHIGDTVNFKYKNDSVVVVSAADYLNCNTSNPISKFEDGNTVFEFDRSGFFYFISGHLDHCRSGQKLIVRVMHPLDAEGPQLAPEPSSAGGDSSSSVWSPRASNSSSKLAALSCSMIALAGLFTAFHFFA